MSQRLIPQVELGPRIGGVKELATRLSFYNGIFNSMLVAALYYGENPMLPVVGVPLQTVIPSILLFYVVLLVGAACLGVWEHAFMVRAQAEYNHTQQFRESVSPVMQEFERVRRRLDEIEDAVED